MRESYLETRYHWPAIAVPEDLFSYFVSETLFIFPDDEISIYNRERFLELLNEDPRFEEFWEQVHELYPERSEYFASLTDAQMPYDPKWIKQEYYKFLYEDEFKDMPETERTQLQAEFNAIRPDAYESALRGEAIRLDCAVSEVRPECPVLALASDADQQSKLTDLPDAIFLKIMNRLDTLDVFRITLVCKQWKNVVHNNPRDLQRAEHAKTTHLITFTEWMDPTSTLSCRVFENNYRRFSFGLIRWCWGITEHLQTVILDQPISYADVAELMQCCPNLKNLQIGCGNGCLYIEDNALFNSDVWLPKLEFYSSRMYNSKNELDLDFKVLLSCKSLLYFGGSLVFDELPAIEIRHRLQHVFGNLIALDLSSYSFVVLELLAEVDQLQLRYLGLGDLSPYYVLTDDVFETTTLRDLLERILPKLKMLEMLKINGVPGIGSSTIKLLTELKLKLKLAVFIESLMHKRCYIVEYPDETDYLEAEVLRDFGQMLLSNDRELDLSDFYFIVVEDEIPHDLREMNLDFTFISVEDYYEIAGCDVGLDCQSIKRRLGIDF